MSSLIQIDVPHRRIDYIWEEDKYLGPLFDIVLDCRLIWASFDKTGHRFVPRLNLLRSDLFTYKASIVYFQTPIQTVQLRQKCSVLNDYTRIHAIQMRDALNCKKASPAFEKAIS